jgi:hypothetical protein
MESSASDSSSMVFCVWLVVEPKPKFFGRCGNVTQTCVISREDSSKRIYLHEYSTGYMPHPRAWFSKTLGTVRVMPCTVRFHRNFGLRRHRRSRKWSQGRRRVKSRMRVQTNDTTSAPSKVSVTNRIVPSPTGLQAVSPAMVMIRYCRSNPRNVIRCGEQEKKWPSVSRKGAPPFDRSGSYYDQRTTTTGCSSGRIFAERKTRAGVHYERFIRLDKSRRSGWFC